MQHCSYSLQSKKLNLTEKKNNKTNKLQKTQVVEK